MIPISNKMQVDMKFAFLGIDGFENYRPVMEIVLSGLSGINKTSLIAFTLAINEAVCNALRYGRNGLEAAQVKLNVFYDGKFLTAQVVSDNDGFDVKGYLNSLSINDDWWKSLRRKSRGRGLWLMMCGSQKVIFNECGNVVTLILDISEKELKNDKDLLARVVISDKPVTQRRELNVAES